MANVLLVNNYNFDEGLLEKILCIADIPDANVLLIMHNQPLPDGFGGFNEGVYYRRQEPVDNEIFWPYRSEKWDYAIAISNKACGYNKEFPAFCVSIIGHELGHLKLGLTDPYTEFNCELINICIVEASNGEIKDYQVPHEVLMDRFGLYIAKKIYSRKQINKELEILIKDTNRTDINRLKFNLELKSSNDFSGLMNECRSFVSPYKDRFKKIIEKKCKEDDYLKERIKNPDELFLLRDD
ncbi:hypothetical protein ACFL6G_02430 [candidate division KSB1 bacterium]